MSEAPDFAGTLTVAALIISRGNLRYKGQQNKQNEALSGKHKAIMHNDIF